MDTFISMFVSFISKEINYDLNLKELVKIKKFVNLHIQLGPWFIRYTIFFMSYFFIFFLIFPRKKKSKLFSKLVIFLKTNNVILFSDLISLFESLIIIKILEKKI